MTDKVAITAMKVQNHIMYYSSEVICANVSKNVNLYWSHVTRVKQLLKILPNTALPSSIPLKINLGNQPRLNMHVKTQVGALQSMVY